MKKFWLVTHSFAMGVFIILFILFKLFHKIDGMLSTGLFTVLSMLALISSWRDTVITEETVFKPAPIIVYPKKKCPPHNWEYINETQRMFCSYCNEHPKT